MSLVYYINLAKSIIVPRQLVPYLGFLVDSCNQAFLLLDEKRQKFFNLVNSLIASDYTDVNTLQHLLGKCISFSLAVPGARLFINEINLAIGRGIRSSRPIRISGPPKSEIQHWTFLESSNGFLPWRAEFHHQVILCSDASSFAWGGVFNPDVQPTSIHDYWPFSQRHLDINAKEFLTLSNVLFSFSENISNCWVDVFTDSQVLSKAWQNQRGKSHSLISALKRLFSVVSASNIHLTLHYIRSDAYPADAPSHSFSLQDSKLSQEAWTIVQGRFGGSSGHSVDLMALPSNVQLHSSGSPLPFFSPFPVPGAAGVKLFAQLPHHQPLLFSNPYVFPPIVLVPQVLRFIICLGFQCTLVVPDLRPRKFWWSLLRPYESFLLAPKGTKGVVLPPSHAGFSTTWPLPWDLWVFRIIPV